VTLPPDGVRSIVVDRDGASVVLSEERWRHIVVGHPEVAEVEAEIAVAIRAPEIVRDGRTAGEACSTDGYQMRAAHPGSRWSYATERREGE
jgi:hypothetical protein